MSEFQRTEYHLVDGRVIPITNHRPKGRGPWPGIKKRTHSLVVAIKDYDGFGFDIEYGNSADDKSVREALKLHFGYQGVSPNQVDLGVNVPESVLNRIKEVVQSATEKGTSQYRQLSDEDRTTGSVFGNIQINEQIDNWKVKIIPQNFSSVIKEPKTGADIGIIVDISNQEDQRTIKVIWLQAKRTREIPRDLFTLKDLGAQIDKMMSYTDHCYAVLYSPRGIYVFHHGVHDKYQALDELITQVLQCKSGDRNLDLLLHTLDSRHVIQFLLTERRRF